MSTSAANLALMATITAEIMLIMTIHTMTTPIMVTKKTTEIMIYTLMERSLKPRSAT